MSKITKSIPATKRSSTVGPRTVSTENTSKTDTRIPKPGIKSKQDSISKAGTYKTEKNTLGNKTPAVTKNVSTVNRNSTQKSINGQSNAVNGLKSRTLTKQQSIQQSKTNNVSSIKKNVKSTPSSSNTSKPNPVLDTYHNVTVASPPSLRKDPPTRKIEEEDLSNESIEKRNRTRTRTLDPEEVVVLTRDSAKQRSQKDVETELIETRSKTVKPAVAFEVKLEESTPQKPLGISAKNKSPSPTLDDEQINYSDDFESYESDFETESSNEDTSTSHSEESSNDNENSSENTSGECEQEQKKRNTDDGNETNIESEEESELTQYPITVIHRKKELEQKLDSGSYEMTVSRQMKINHSQHQQFDSIDTLSTAASDQLDSGLSSDGNIKEMESDASSIAVSFGGYKDFHNKSNVSKRGQELMSKIQFDMLTFILLDMRPISYEVYMQTYGKLNTAQCSSQTSDYRVTVDCQTEELEMRSMWTQHPPQYDLQTVQKLSYAFTRQNCCGESSIDDAQNPSKMNDEYDDSLLAMAKFKNENNNRSTYLLGQHHKPIDIDRLNVFLRSTSMILSNIFDTKYKPIIQQKTSNTEIKDISKVSEGFYKLDTSILNALQVIKIFANSNHNLIVTVHESLPNADVYRSEFSNLLMVWTATDPRNPIRLLSTWSEVCHGEICATFPDIIICGLTDGSIAMWDLRETYSFCSKLDGHLTHFPATQSVVPTLNDQGGGKTELIDIGAVIDVRSFRPPLKTIGTSYIANSYRTIQFVSLNDTGYLTVWSLMDTGKAKVNNNRIRSRNRVVSSFEYSSPWARVKLIQSAICNLREYLEADALKLQSQFDRTKDLFQRNIYNDEVLRELSDTKSNLRHNKDLQGLRFAQIGTGCEQIYVCTNRNFVLACTKTLKSERFRRITVNDNRYLFPTALTVLANENFLAIGLSNGSVMIVNCSNHQGLSEFNKELETPTNKHIPPTEMEPESEVDLLTGKSCAIQNIILNERRSLKSGNNFDNDYMERPDTTACISMIETKKKPFELYVYDKQLLLSGSILRKHMIQSLELSYDGWRLFVLTNGEVRTYDFYLDRELKCFSDAGKCSDIATARTDANKQNLVILNGSNEVEIHILRQ